jgi:carboxylesterase type B
MGESAGAVSVDALITSLPDPLPFHAAILQSVQNTLRLSPTSSWNALINVTKCPPDNALEFIRAIPARQLKELVERNQLAFIGS